MVFLIPRHFPLLPRFFILGCGKTDVAFLLQVVMSWDIEEESRHRRREPTRSCTAVRSGVAANGVAQSADCRLDAYESVPTSTMSKHRKSSQLDSISGYESCLLCTQFCHYFVKALSF